MGNLLCIRGCSADSCTSCGVKKSPALENLSPTRPRLLSSWLDSFTQHSPPIVDLTRLVDLPLGLPYSASLKGERVESSHEQTQDVGTRDIGHVADRQTRRPYSFSRVMVRKLGHGGSGDLTPTRPLSDHINFSKITRINNLAIAGGF